MPELLQHMLDLKVSPDVARQLFESTPTATLQFQLDCLPDRNAKNPAAIFIKAVREAWDAPAQYVDRQQAAESAKQAKRAQEAGPARKAAEKAKEREETALQDQEAARLDAMFEKLDGRTQQRIEAQTQERLGVLGQLERAEGARLAMRRNLLRELLGQTTTPDQTK